MRHVSRIHRVALDRLFDRINLDPKIQIKYIDTKNQLADTLTKGNFTRDERVSLDHSEWNAFSDSVSCLGKLNQNSTSNVVWENIELVQKSTTMQNFGHN